MTQTQREDRKHKSELVLLLLHRLRYRWLGDPDAVSDAIADIFQAELVWRERLVSDLVVACRAGVLRRSFELRSFFRSHKVVHSLSKSPHWRSIDSTLRRHMVAEALAMQRKDWTLPSIPHLDRLSQWLSLPSPRTIDWLTLPHKRRSTKTCHYRRTRIRKRDGGIRYIEEPKPTLKRVQKTIASSILPFIPLHEAAHGFRRGRSIGTCAAAHVAQDVVLRIDLHNFFGSIGTSRVAKLFQIAGYSKCVGLALARLCTLPASAVIDDDPQLQRSRLPQGSPTSPALANAIAFRLDRRLAGLAKSLDATYTRYADDMIFSGDADLAKRTECFVTSASAIAMEEGFEVNFRKTAVMRLGHRQTVLGLTVNKKLSTSRREYDNLRATLNNCIHHGPASQNRDENADFKACLRGKIAHIGSFHPQRYERLLAMFDQIGWDA